MNTIRNKGKKIFAAGLCACLIIFQLVSTVIATDLSLPIVTYDAFSDSIKIDGSMPISAGSAVTVNITPGSNPISDSHLPVISKMYFASENGTLNFAISLPDSFEDGKYTVYIGMEHIATAHKATVMVFDKNSAETAAVIDAINASTSAGQLTDILTDSAGSLGIDTDAIDDMSAVCQTVFSLKQAEGSFDYASFNRAFKVGLALEMKKDGANTDSIMKLYADIFETDYNTYSALDANVKAAFDSLFTRIELTQRFWDFGDVSLLAGVIGSESYGELKELVSKNAVHFSGIDFDGDYAKLSVNNRSKVFGEMFAERSQYSSFEDVELSFDKAVEKLLYEQTSSKKDNVTGGGGSGNGFSVGVAVTPEIVPGQPSQEATANDYTDVKGHYAELEIKALSQKRIITGFEDGTFKPDAPVTRAQFAKLVTLAFNLQMGDDIKSFDDVELGVWYKEYIDILSSKNIVSGDGTNFYPDATVTRQDAAVILYNTLNILDKKCVGTATFADSGDISQYAKASVEALAANGIIKGDEHGFRPLNTLSRAEAAVLLYRLINA